MELFPALSFGWLNGWLVILLLGLVDGILFLAFPKEVVKRLFDRSGWSQKQRAFTVAGKLCALLCLALIALTPLKIGQPVFAVGMVFAMVGLTGLAKALFDFKNTPVGAPVTLGIYKVSRHPQIVMSSLVLFGACLTIGSWPALILLAAARILSHWGILAEEEACLKKYGEGYRAYLQQTPRYFVVF
ncbi:MAG: methyltransferase family protein [Chloroflexota bacterium]